MLIKDFQAVTQTLLRTHLGIDLGDTNLTEDEIVAGEIARGSRPFEVVNDHAEDCDLVRVDLPGFFGIPAWTPLTDADEIAAMRQLGVSHGL